MPRRTLSDAFDRKQNSLNAIRLLLAIGVILGHSPLLAGKEFAWGEVGELRGQFWVDGFFAISGFLILGSWLANPSPRRYLRARAIRILPAFYVCLIVTAAVFAPIGILLSGTGQPIYSFESLSYVLKNAALWMFQFDIAGSPSGIPYPGVWNGSLWTLFWEFLCYLAILAAGVAGLLRFRATVPLIFIASWIALLASSADWVESENVAIAARFGLMFSAGALVYQLTRKLPVSWPLVIGALAVATASTLLPEYRLVAAPFLAYGLIGLGALANHKRLVLRNDFSYGMYIYAFPVQQLLVLLGLSALPLFGFAIASVAATLPLAAASWFLVEKPLQKFKRRGGRLSKQAAPDAVRA
ncbi:acyltransferase family protein [Microterricola gilva]|nr:acyltransferase [Microterricola gilva]